MFKKILLVLALTLLSGVSFAQTIQPNPKKTLVYSLTGSYSSTFNSNGKITAWYIYDDGTIEGQWRTDIGSIAINTKGSLKLQEKTRSGQTTQYIVFKAAGQIVLPNGIVVTCSLMGKGEFTETLTQGDYILLIDNDNINSDFGTFQAAVRGPRLP